MTIIKQGIWILKTCRVELILCILYFIFGLLKSNIEVKQYTTKSLNAGLWSTKLRFTSWKGRLSFELGWLAPSKGHVFIGVHIPLSALLAVAATAQDTRVTAWSWQLLQAEPTQPEVPRHRGKRLRLSRCAESVCLTVFQAETQWSPGQQHGTDSSCSCQCPNQRFKLCLGMQSV